MAEEKNPFRRLHGRVRLPVIAIFQALALPAGIIRGCYSEILLGLCSSASANRGDPLERTPWMQENFSQSILGAFLKSIQCQ